MADKRTDKSLIMCILSCFIPFACYGAERLVHYQNLLNGSVGIALAFVFTALTGLVFFMISRIENPIYGLFAAIFSFKLMPTAIYGLVGLNLEAGAVYSIVRMAALLLFALLIVKHFKAQKLKESPIDVLPIIALVFIMTMLREPSMDLYNALFVILNGSLYGVYFAQAIIYLWAVAIIYVVTIKSNNNTIKFVSAFEIVAMSINILRRLGTIIVCLINNSHISASYYCWILIYVLVMTMFAISLKKANKKA